MPTSRGYPTVSPQDAPRGPDQINAVAEAVNADVAAVDLRVVNTRNVADNALNTGRSALEVPLVRAAPSQAITTASGGRGSIALSSTVIAAPTTMRTPNSETRLVAPVPGYYVAYGYMEWEGASAGARGARLLQVRKVAATNPNGGFALGPDRRLDPPTGVTYAVGLPFNYGPLSFGTGEYAEVFVEHGQGSGLAITTNSWMVLEFLRPLP